MFSLETELGTAILVLETRWTDYLVAFVALAEARALDPFAMMLHFRYAAG